MKSESLAPNTLVKRREADGKTDEIRAMYVTGKYSLKEIEAKFGMGRHSVRNRLRPQDRPPSRRSNARRRAIVKVGIVEEWSSGDFSLNTLAERWGRTRNDIAAVLKERGESALNHEHRNRRIGELMAAGHDRERLSERYGLSKTYITTLAWRGAGREDERICPECQTPFAPKDSRHVYCVKDCALKAKHHTNICLACGESFPSVRVDQKVCDLRCRDALKKIRSIEVSLRARELRRRGYTFAKIAEKCELSVSGVRSICTEKKRSEYLAALETVRRHKGKAWLSGVAKLEVRRALTTLKAHGLERYALRAKF